MGESVAVIIIVTILIVVGIAIFSQMEKRRMEGKELEFEEYDVIAVSQRVSALPELQKSDQGISKMVTFDIQRIHALTGLINSSKPGSRTRTYYNTIFGTSNIYVQEIYNGGASNKLYSIYNNTPVNFTRMTPSRIYVSLYDPLKNSYALGVLTVEQYNS